MFDLRSVPHTLGRYLQVSPSEFEEIREDLKSLRLDATMRVVSIFATAVLIFLLGHQTIAVVFLVWSIINELIATVTLPTIAVDPAYSPNVFDLTAWNTTFGVSAWVGLALALCATNNPMEIVLGFAVFFGVLVNIMFCYTSSARLLVFAMTPIIFGVTFIPFLLFGNSIFSREFLGALIGCGLLIAYGLSATYRNKQLTQNLVEARKQAEELARSKSEFLANMSHEIRTPMNGILGFAELLKNSDIGERQKDFAETIHSSGSALLTILNDILDFSKIEAGKIELDPAPFCLRNAVEDVAALLSPSANEKGIELLVRCRPSVPASMIGDVGRIRQVLTNLTGNAIKFTHEGHVLIDVSATVSQETALIKISVEDTGIGIPESKIDHVFGMFTQAETSTTRMFGGTGLGLAISSSLVTEMGGDISVQSTYGEGSIFEVSLTLDLSEAVGGRASAVPNDVDVDQTVLVVDDNAVNRLILAEQLQTWGIKSRSFDGGQAALAHLDGRGGAQTSPIILLDYHMPEMDGLMFLERVRRHPTAADARVIVLSSVDDKTITKQFEALGVVDIAAKPIRLNTLRTLLANAVGGDKRVELSTTKQGIDLGDSCERKDTSHARVLIAEDNETNRMLLQHMIDQTVYRLTFADNGKQAFDLFRKHSFDLILMDISMPEMDGIEATKAIRSFEVSQGLSPTPIVALTAHKMSGDRERFESVGMDGYLSKPVPAKALNEILLKWGNRDEERKIVNS